MKTLKQQAFQDMEMPEKFYKWLTPRTIKEIRKLSGLPNATDEQIIKGAKEAWRISEVK